MTHKVTFLDAMDAKVRDEIRSELPPGFSIDFAETTDRREHLAMVADTEFILTTIFVDGEMIRAAPRLKLLHKWGIGVDKFDLDAKRHPGGVRRTARTQRCTSHQGPDRRRDDCTNEDRRHHQRGARRHRDEAALYDALVSGKLHGAGLDVFAMEPPDPANPLFRLDQVVATPHTAGSVIDLVAEFAGHTFTNMQSVLRGTPLPPDDVIVAAGENK
jgi:phosphoglycerate dehydrogenase-like enzyme